MCSAIIYSFVLDSAKLKYLHLKSRGGIAIDVSHKH